MLAVEGLAVSYGEVAAVRRVDFTLEQGRILALVGANGAGKTTTLAAISGLVAASAGRIVFDGVDVTRARPEARSRLGMALTPEGRRVFGGLTVAENLLLGGAVHMPADERRVREEELLALFPVLRSRYRLRASNLSGGEQQMLAIARSLMSNPKLLMLDEPSLGLAPQIIDAVFDQIAELRRAGLTILLVEQNVALALEIADSAVVLVNGAVALSGTAAELEASDLVRQAYLGV